MIRESALGRARRAERERVKAALRVQLRERSGGWCEVKFSPYCSKVGQGMHHLKKTSQGGQDTLANTLWSCNICNDAIEDEPIRAYAAGLVVKSWEPSR